VSTGCVYCCGHGYDKSTGTWDRVRVRNNLTSIQALAGIGVATVILVSVAAAAASPEIALVRLSARAGECTVARRQCCCDCVERRAAMTGSRLHGVLCNVQQRRGVVVGGAAAS
jgi:hypothetical protein